MDYENKLKALRDRYPDEESLGVILGWEKNLKHSNLFLNLKGHDAVKIILANYEKELATIDKELTENDALFKDEEGKYLGRLLHVRKRFIKRFINYFDAEEKKINTVTNLISKKLLNDEN